MKTEIDTLLTNYYLKTSLYNKTEIDTLSLNHYLKTEIDTTFSNYYLKTSLNSKTEIDTLLLNHYLKTEVDTILTNYYLKTSLYSKTEIDTLLLNHYLKTEVDTLLASKQNLLTNNTVDNYQILTGNKIRNLIQGDQITLSYDENNNILIKADVSTNYKTYNEVIPLVVGFPAFNSGLSLKMDVITNNPAGTGEVLFKRPITQQHKCIVPFNSDD